MKKLILLLLFIPLVFSCSGDDDGPTYYLELNSTQNRVEFNQITLPGYILNPTSQQQTDFNYIAFPSLFCIFFYELIKFIH